MNPKLRLATKKDDARIRQILRENPIEGKISLAYHREPSYFGSIKIEGYKNQVIVGELDNKVIGFGTRSIRKAYINGKVTDVGYLNGLRLEKKYRGKGLLKYGYLYLKKLHKRDGKIKLYYSTIIDDNWLAKKILTDNKPYLPHYININKVNVIAIRLLDKIKQDSEYKIIKGNKRLSKEIFKFLNNEGKKKQFFLYYFKNLNLKDLNIDDFYVAIKNNKIVGVCAKWNQEKFKQTIVTNYKGFIKISRFFYNFNAKRRKHPLLPSVGKMFHYFYLSFIVVKDNNNKIFKSLLNKVYNDYVNTKFSYFIFGLCGNDPLMNAISDYKYINYPSSLYIIIWEDGKKEFEKLDDRIPYIEVATL